MYIRKYIYVLDVLYKIEKISTKKKEKQKFLFCNCLGYRYTGKDISYIYKFFHKIIIFLWHIEKTLLLEFKGLYRYRKV